MNEENTPIDVDYHGNTIIQNVSTIFDATEMLKKHDVSFKIAYSHNYKSRHKNFQTGEPILELGTIVYFGDGKNEFAYWTPNIKVLFIFNIPRPIDMSQYNQDEIEYMPELDFKP